MTNKKKAIIVSIMGKLVKRTASRHYWLYDGVKWVRLGLTRIADALKISTDVIKAAIYTATKKAFENIVNGFLYHDEKKVDQMKFTIYGDDSQYACSKLLKGYDLYLFKDLTGYAGKINKFDYIGKLQETYFVTERKIFGRRLGGWAFVPHYDDTKAVPQKTLEKVWGTFLRQASKHGFIMDGFVKEVATGV